LKKSFVKLNQKDLYFFKDEYDTKHIKLINLSGVFVQEDKKIQHNHKFYYSFSLESTAGTKIYITDKHEEYIHWVVCLQKATGFSDITLKYEFVKIIAEGKFGIVKLAKHKETGRLVAVKIIDKSNMSKNDFNLIKSEIEILKIAQHPNLIKLYDIMETKSKMYISK
jgi:hypothetical protein